MNDNIELEDFSRDVVVIPKAIPQNLEKVKDIKQKKKKDAIFVTENFLILLRCCFGLYGSFVMFDVYRTSKKTPELEQITQISLQSTIIIWFSIIITCLCLIIHSIIGIINHICNKIIDKNKIKNVAFTFDIVSIWFPLLISCPLLAFTICKIVVGCIIPIKYNMFEVNTNNLLFNSVLSISLLSTFVIVTFIIQIPILYGHLSLGTGISKKLSILNYCLAFIGCITIASASSLYTFYNNSVVNTMLNNDLKSQVILYYQITVGASISSGITALLIGLLGFISAAICSKILIFVTSIITFYSLFIFIWSCSLAWFGNKLINLFCTVENIIPNIRTEFYNDLIVFRNSCNTKINFYIVAATIIIQLVLAIVCVIYGIVILTNKILWNKK
ncbi:hypothetical protein ACR3K2_28080 [Cryptosporidium serpentis]